MASLVGAIVDRLTDSGVDVAALGLAWARVMPAVVLVPAFGLRALPAPARAVLGLALAGVVFPAIAAPAGAPAPMNWAAALAVEVLRGLPVAIAAAVPLWAATMAGGVADALRGAHDAPSLPTVEGRATPLGAPFSLLASALFLASGGPARVVMALAVRSPGALDAQPLYAAASVVVDGITLAVAVGGPLLAASVVVEVAAALVARASTPAQVHALLAPVRAFATLAVTAFVFERIATALARAAAAAP